MAEPSRYYTIPPGRRSPVLYNPARASLPVAMNYAPYEGDIHVMPTSRHDSMPRPVGDYRPANSVPVTTTTYAVRKDREPRDTGRIHRSSTIDSSSKRPPIIVTTKHVPPGSHPIPTIRSESPSRDISKRPEERGDVLRDPYRSSDEGPYLTQPASSHSRSRSTTRAPFSAALDNDEYARLRERTGDERLHASRPAEYRPPPPRPIPVYHHLPPRHANAIDYGDEGYEYTKPSDLARYDLDTTRPHRPRRESFDRNYYRPSVSVTTDIGRPYEQNDRRQRGPPPTTRGLDRVNRGAAAGIYDAPQLRMPIPPPVPLAPDPARRSGHHLVPGSPTTERRGSSSRTRPVSLYQEGPGWPHHDDPYRSREDPMLPRDHRDRDPKYFPDDSVTNRGFGIRVETKDPEEYRREFDARVRDERRERRESRREFDDREPRRRSDEDLEPVKTRDERREHDHRDHRGGHDELGARQRKDAREKDHPVHDDDVPEKKRDKIKDKVATGLELAAATIGIGAAMKSKDGKNDKEDASPAKRRKDAEDDHRRDSDDSDAPSDRHKSSKKELVDRQPKVEDEVEIVEPPRERERDYPRRERPAETVTASRDHDRRHAEAKSNEGAPEHSSRDQSTSEDDVKGRHRTRRRHTGSAFDPNDAAGIMALKAQLAASDREKAPEKAQEKAQEKAPDRVPEKPTIVEPSPPSSPDLDNREVANSETQLVIAEDDDSRGRELVPPPHEEKQVRVVSPPREKDQKKPVKGILKQPRSKFPEDKNPIREGVAPHKDDKTKANVPPGARWTKINRQLVNPEALTIGKERFEVRDDFVIVLRVLSKEEIQAYATATAQLRG